MGEQGVNSWAKWPLISCQLRSWFSGAVLGKGRSNNSGGNAQLWLDACPTITQHQHLLPGCLLRRSQTCIPLRVCFASVTIYVLQAKRPGDREALELPHMRGHGEDLTRERVLFPESPLDTHSVHITLPSTLPSSHQPLQTPSRTVSLACRSQGGS